MSDLKLIALDAENLAILSAHLQDAVLLVGDMAFLPAEKRFAAIMNRFDWARHRWQPQSARTAPYRVPLRARAPCQDAGA